MVKTGKYADGDEHAVDGKYPNYVFPSIVEVVRNFVHAPSNTLD